MRVHICFLMINRFSRKTLKNACCIKIMCTTTQYSYTTAKIIENNIWWNDGGKIKNKKSNNNNKRKTINARVYAHLKSHAQTRKCSTRHNKNKRVGRPKIRSRLVYYVGNIILARANCQGRHIIRRRVYFFVLSFFFFWFCFTYIFPDGFRNETPGRLFKC